MNSYVLLDAEVGTKITTYNSLVKEPTCREDWYLFRKYDNQKKMINESCPYDKIKLLFNREMTKKEIVKIYLHIQKSPKGYCAIAIANYKKVLICYNDNFFKDNQVDSVRNEIKAIL